MALRKINTRLEAISIGPKKGEQKTVAGYLIGARYGIGKSKKNKGNTIFSFVKKDKSRERFDVWGNASITNALCVDGQLNPGLSHQFIKIQFVKMGKAKKGQSAPKNCDVFADSDDVMKTGTVLDFKKATKTIAKRR